MQYFKYLKDYHESWECFAGYEDIPKENYLKVKDSSINLYMYEFVEEIMKACDSGAINKDTFNLHNYTAQCWQNEKRNRIKDSNKRKNLVPDLKNGETTVGYGDITEGQAYAINTNYEAESKQSQEEQVIESIDREYYLKSFKKMTRKYLMNKGIDLKFVVKESLNGNKRTQQLLKEYTAEDSGLANLIQGLCTECAGYVQEMLSY